MDIGMSELLVIGIVALVVIGPRDLPEMFRQLGRMTAKMRGMAREFNRAMEQAANETGVKDVAKDLKAITSPQSMGLNAVKGAVDKFEKWDPIKNAAKPTVVAKPLTPPPMPATPVLAAAPVTTEPAIMPPVTAPGPATAALYDKKAAREAILAESAAKLKALDEAPDMPAVAKPALAPAAFAQTAFAKPAAAAAPAKPAPKPRAPAKSKATASAVDAAAPPPLAKTPRKKKATEE